jgi:hypothetical protein
VPPTLLFEEPSDVPVVVLSVEPDVLSVEPVVPESVVPESVVPELVVPESVVSDWAVALPETPVISPMVRTPAPAVAVTPQIVARLRRFMATTVAVSGSG